MRQNSQKCVKIHKNTAKFTKTSQSDYTQSFEKFIICKEFSNKATKQNQPTVPFQLSLLSLQRLIDKLSPATNCSNYQRSAGSEYIVAGLTLTIRPDLV